MNYYDTLEVSKDASNSEIKKAYKKLVKKYHPDVFKGDKAIADTKIKELNEAYETLSNSELKKAYDEVLFAVPSSQIDYSLYSQTRKSNQTPDEKYEDLHRYDYYKRYTTNYYGVPRDDLKKQKNSESDNDNFVKIPDFIRFLLVVFFGILAIVVILSLIWFLSFLKSSLDAPTTDIYDYEHHHDYAPTGNITKDDIDEIYVMEIYKALQNEIY